ncbi:hypothetical protein [Hymenobacter cellulosilyticus]|uniref:Uncharacterized protein n=1 Tax=Hymenobacter cellulosilyticus TaxID=2932248 RepID=A0A8T9QCG3_9BACT|nr:hypothetical protein [Hymenobacter cellulosilyticus]UOQ75226.1 hypothetical protein MUN79_29545 [Hymenobacter cellulosilyticus]
MTRPCITCWAPIITTATTTRGAGTTRPFFSLHHSEVANLEIGPDYVAFDTEFVRYPEDDELHAPGPWTDRFRATILFDQLYQLLRKVVPAGQDVGERLTFQSTDAVYYNERIHRENYPTRGS